MNRRRHRQHGNPFNVRGDIQVPDWETLYGRSAPMALDIGFGSGGFTLELALQHPEWNVLGLEIREHLVRRLLERARQLEIRNLHAVLANASMHLDALVPERTVAFVAINFPDPWYKKRHHKRRIIRPHWIETLATKLCPGAELHVMTDYEEVASQIRAVLVDAVGFASVIGGHAFADKSTTGIASEREVTHSKRGERIWRLFFRFQSR